MLVALNYNNYPHRVLSKGVNPAGHLAADRRHNPGVSLQTSLACIVHVDDAI